MATNLSFDTASLYLKEQGLSYKELTYSSNGYPDFKGEVRFAFYGFDSFEEAEEMATLFGGSLKQIHWKDGALLAESMGSAFAPMSISTDRYGDNYYDWSPELKLISLKERCAEAETFDEIKELVDNFDFIYQKYMDKIEESDIILVDGEHYVDTISPVTMSWKHDTHNYEVALVINSADYQ